MAALRRTWERLGRRLVPDSAFWRLVLATAVLAVITAGGAMIVSDIIGRQLVFSISQDSSYTVLRNAVDLIGRTSAQIEEARVRDIETRKQSLLESLDFVEGFLKHHAGNRGQDGESRQQCLDRLEELSTKSQPFHGVLDAAGTPLLVAGSLPQAGGVTAEALLQRLQTMKTSPEEGAFALFFPPGEDAAVILARRDIELWELTLFAAAALPQKDPALEEKTRLTLNEMRARLNEIVVAESGYVYAFDDDCAMIVHPTLIGEEFASIMVPGSKEPLCRALKRTAMRPWGENFLHYDWDRPEDKGRYVHEKISWCTVEPTTGWVVGASVYTEDLEAPVPRFVSRIFLPALGSILLLGLALALILRSLLKPVNDLSRVCQRVSHGDLDVSAPVGASGEIGKLCWHFNAMIKRIRGLRQRDERRRNELEELNQTLERKVSLRTRALERKAHKLEEANIRLKELDKLKTSFVSSVSHELRTPLTSILGFAKMIRRDFFKLQQTCDLDGGNARHPGRIENNLEIIIHEGERLARLINDLLDLARIEAGRMEWHDALIDFQEVAMDCLDSMYAQFQAKPDVAVRHDIQPGIPAVYADRDRLTQVLLNLMNNALKFTASGSITLQACHGDGVLQCRVCDSGPGIERSELTKVFDRFHQVSERASRKDKPAGTGLGLAICNNILEHYGGVIWAESSPGRGTAIIFELPLRADQDARQPEDATDMTLRFSLRRSRRLAQEEAPLVLVVDDDRHMQSLLLHLFEDAGYRVATASDGAEALERVRRLHPDLVTMDLLMPGMPGSEVISLLRKDPDFAGTPVILVSALADMAADDYTASDAVFSKPVDEELLLATAQALLLQDPLPGEFRELFGQDGYTSDDALVCTSGGECGVCTLQEAKRRVAQGFTGQIFVPRGNGDLARLQALLGRSGVQVVMV